MNDSRTSKNHWSFWVISTVALIWNVLGGANFFMQMNADFVTTLPDTHRAIIVGRPFWATAGFAFTVFGGAIGCVLLLLRKSAAAYLFVASLLGVIATMLHTMRVASSVIEFSIGEIVVMIVMPVLVAAFLLWYSKYAEAREWIS